MSEQPDPPKDPQPVPPTPRRVVLDVTLKRDPHAYASHLEAPWTSARSWVLAFFLGFCAASWYGWVELRGHPIALYVSALPQLAALLAAITTLFGGGDPNAAKTWYQTRATTMLRWLDRRAVHVCTGLAISSALVGYAGASMGDIDVQCPSGCRLSYGHLGAFTNCDQPHDRIWMPLGLAQVESTFQCSMSGGHDEWAPLRREVRDDDGTREVFSCYEDGDRVVSHPAPVVLEYLEYGWADSTPERSPAPCDHLQVGIYSYDPTLNACTWLMTLDELTQAFRDVMSASDADPTTRDALGRMIGSECHDCPAELVDDASGAIDTSVDAGEAGNAAPPPTPLPVAVRSTHARAHGHDTGKPDVCPRPEEAPFTFFQPDGCHGNYGDVVLELSARQVAIPVGLSYRGASERRCVPTEARRDGYVHLQLPDGELVFGLTLSTPHRVYLIEDVRTTTPPPALAAACPP